MKIRDIIENMDKRGPLTRSQIAKRARKVEQRLAATRSANEAGYRRGKEEQDRELNTRHDAAMNTLRNEMAAAFEDTKVKVDREFVKGWLDAVAFLNEANPAARITVLSMRMANGICRELERLYAKEERAA
jgi:hypothetical protein